MPDPTAQNPPVDPPSTAVEPPAAPGAGTPDAAAAESGRLHAVPRAEREAVHAACRAAHSRAAQLLQVSDDRIILAAIKAYRAARQATPEAHSGAGLILGRALLDQYGGLWPLVGEEQRYRCGVVTPSYRPRFEAEHGSVREVLLVPVEAGPVLEAALRWGEARDAWTDDPEQVSAASAYLEAERKLAAAVDAATSGQPPPVLPLEREAEIRAHARAPGALLDDLADRIESGALTPWADQPDGPCGKWEPELGPCIAERPCSAHDQQSEEPVQSEEPALTVPDSPKMLRETLCVAQTGIGQLETGRRQEHIARLGQLIDQCDQHRPLGPDGKHGQRHTATCGCEDKKDAPEPDSPQRRLTRFEASRPWNRAAEPTPERAGDGPGWDREAVQDFRNLLLAGDSPLQLDRLTRRGAGVQLDALLADRDRLATGQAPGAVVAAWAAELAEVTAHRDQLLIFLGAAEDARNARMAERNEWRDRAATWGQERDEARRELAEVEAERDELRPTPCNMTHTPPFDFAQCETHDDTFALGQKCRFDGREMWEVFAEEADAQRQRAVKAEMALARLLAEPETRPCRNELEPDGVPCTGTLTFGPGEPQAKCPSCGAWEGVHAPPRVPAADTPEPSDVQGLILGRALVDADGDVWPQSQSGPSMWRVPSGKSRYGQQEVEVVAVEPPARVVLLVPVEAGPVLEAALARVAHIHESSSRPGGVHPWVWADEDEMALIAAVDAATSRQPVEPQRNSAPEAVAPREPAPDLAPASDPPDGRTCPCPRDGWHALCAIHQDRNPELLAAIAAYREAAGDAPEPDSDGPEALVQLLREMRDQHLDAYADRVEHLVQVAIDAGAELVAEEQETVDRLRAELEAERTRRVPEPAGDGTGWDRCGIHSVINAMELAARDPAGGTPQVTAEDVAELRALLADRDQKEEAAAAALNQLAVQIEERNTARAELAEVTAHLEGAYRAMVEAEHRRMEQQLRQDGDGDE